MLIPYEPQEFIEIIRHLLRTELLKLKSEAATLYEVPGLTQKPLFKGKEVCQMLNISRVTLDAWVKEGLLTKYKVRSRVYFLWADIEKLISPKDTPKPNGSA
jgi:excisionase family DNA binding protein